MSPSRIDPTASRPPKPSPALLPRCAPPRPDLPVVWLGFGLGWRILQTLIMRILEKSTQPFTLTRSILVY